MDLSVARLQFANPETLLARSSHILIEPDTVHVWAFALEGATSCVEICRSYLSTAEQQRADRFIFERDRLRYIVAHGVLRKLLSRYCRLPANSLRFNATSAGKPALESDASAAPPLRFNLTHCENRALLGVSRDRELGIDLEKVRSNIEALAISRHYFFGSERDAIEAADPAERDHTFFRHWVAKEAVLKAQGIGLGFPLDRFRVDFLPDGTTAHIDSFDSAALEPDWNVRMLPCEHGWLGALAARGTDWRVKLESSDVTEPPHL
jgi:4'-phosphopantetheinyl transferase